MEQVWQADAKYTFQEYNTELTKLWCVNNGNSDITSGLLTEQNWLQGHRAVVCDLSRQGLGYTKNLIMKGKIQGDRTMNLRVFIIKLKCMLIYIATGESKMVPVERDEVLGKDIGS